MIESLANGGSASRLKCFHKIEVYTSTNSQSNETDREAGRQAGTDRQESEPATHSLADWLSE